MPSLTPAFARHEAVADAGQIETVERDHGKPASSCRSGMRDGEHLEQTAHLPRIDQARHRLRNGRTVFLVRFRGQQSRAGADAERFQERGLRDGAVDARAGVARRIGDGGEIDMGGEIGRANLRQGIAEAVRLHRLQRVAHGAGDRAIIDEQGGDARLCHARADGAGQRQGSRAYFGDLARLRALVRRLQQAELWPGRQQRPGQRIVREIDAALAPALLGHLELMDRQGVQELVADDDRRLIGQASSDRRASADERRRAAAPAPRARAD